MDRTGPMRASRRWKSVTCAEHAPFISKQGELRPMAQSGREIIANAPRLERYMDANGLEAVAVRTGANFTYLAGIALPGTLARHLDISSTVRGFMLVWP